jgi:hypothetical protein
MTLTAACPICGTPRPANRASSQPWYCSIACFNTGHGITQPEPPSCHDAVTMRCPVCQRPFVPAGRQVYCGDPCKAAAYRRRRDAHNNTPVVIPKARPRRPITVYECDSCGERALGEQRCEMCSTFMRRVGVGGCCPTCDAPIAIHELVDKEATT